jgi:hypothetical protein
VPLETPEQVLAVLVETPRLLAQVTSGIDDRRLQRPPGQDEWPARDVLAHLRSCSDVWGDAVGRMLVEDAPTLQAVNPTTWIDRTDYLQQPFSQSLAAFTAQRAELLAVLEPLAPAAWSRTAVVTGAGRPLERTVLSYATRLARHERPHVKQIERALAD